MWILTTAGFYSVVQDLVDPDYLVVWCHEQEAAQIAIDALETQFGGTLSLLQDAGLYGFRVDRERFAQWVASEVRDYVTYTDFTTAIVESKGPIWNSALERVNDVLSWPPIVLG